MATQLMSQLYFAVQGPDWNGQLKFGSNEFYGECLLSPQHTVLMTLVISAVVVSKVTKRALDGVVRLRAGVNYLQSVTPRLALGGEAFWLGQQRKSGTGFAGRFTGDAFVATAQVATTGLVSLTYVQRISEKVRLGTALPKSPLTGCVGPQSAHFSRH